jgi:Tfp pilus assembly pilus retraction ATPase PilT
MIFIIMNLKETIRRIIREESKNKTSELTERCWKGYTQKGMKTMFGKRYPNCVKIKKK